MKNVILHRSQLLAIVPDGQVFNRPIQDAADITPEQRAEDDKVRYEAWEACKFVVGGASVFAGICGGQRVYVVIEKRVYDESRHPVPVLTKEADDLKRAKEEAQERKASRQKASSERRAQRLSRYEIIPRHHCGVDYGHDMRVMIRTRTHVMAWRPGRNVYIDRGAGSEYQRGEFTILPYEIEEKPSVCDHRGTAKLGYACIFGGKGHTDIVAPVGFVMSPKALMTMFDKFEKALGLTKGLLKEVGWTGEKTLVIK